MKFLTAKLPNWVFILTIFVVVIVVGLVTWRATLILKDIRQISSGPVIPERSTLSLNNSPKLFEKDAMIVVGEKATEIEKESAEEISKKLEELAGNKPEIKIATKIVEKEKADYNLIIVGSPESNSVFQEVYKLTNATAVTKEYPGENKGILEILKNPWNEDKALLLVTGSDEQGVAIGLGELYYLTLSEIKFKESKGKEIAIKEVMKEQLSSWTPRFNNCTSACYFIETKSGEIYYLANICTYVALLPGEKLTESKVIVGESGSLPFLNKQIEVKGKLEKREVSVPLRKEPSPPTKIGTFNVIVVAELKVLTNENY